MTLVALDAVAIEDRRLVGLAVPVLVVALCQASGSDLGRRLRRRRLGEVQREGAQHVGTRESGAEAGGETRDAVGRGRGSEARPAGLADASAGDHAAERLGVRAAEGDAAGLQACTRAAGADGAVGRRAPTSPRERADRRRRRTGR